MDNDEGVTTEEVLHAALTSAVHLVPDFVMDLGTTADEGGTFELGMHFTEHDMRIARRRLEVDGKYHIVYVCITCEQAEKERATGRA